ncbi:hypothetical protein BG015_001141 [Linnemannia schmuckeri]|uniref:Uncharacterized protein n=1 Tax=Linnemannia schmuckeri TaxID=64567 RepID=A0A9P5S3P9_9FUNG|nr:hypothetical protein BG015_001141 [Linnemannia schmuckeri]
MSGLSQPFRQGPDGEVNHLEVSEEPQTKQYVIYWDDIRRVYRKALHIKNGSMIVNLARNQHGQCYEPDCIKYYPGVTLEVVEGEDSDTQTSSIPLAKVFAAPSAPTSDYYNPPLTCAQAHNTAKLSLFESTEPSLTLGSLTIHETATATAASSTVLVSTSINRTAFVSPTPISHRLLQRTQSMLQESSTQLVRYESSLQAGQIVQADAIMQGMQAMRKDIQEEFRVLHSEVAKSEELKELKQLIQEMKATADVQTKRIIELQELSVKLQQEALDRLALMQIKIASILTQTYELHEYPIPRLFIVLPKEDATRTETAGRGVKNLFAKQFKLYFLCECGDHTKSHDGPATNPSLKHEIHIALHEGYDIDRPTEFFDKYGPYILTLLQMLKYGVTIAGVVVPPLGKLSVVDSLKDVADGINHVLKDIGPRVDSSIAYIEKLTGIQSQLSTADSTSSLTDPTTLGGPEALEGADLRQLDSFLKTKDKGRVLGNLYRIVTGEGHVKWVCLDHYRENYRAKATQDLRDAIEEVLGIYNESTGSVQAWPWSSRVARRFYSVLSSSRCVQELSLYFRWKPSMQDLRDLRDAIKSTNIGHIRITSEDNTPPRSDLLNNGRRFEPILQMISSGNIRSLELEGWGGFLERISNVPVTLGVRRLRIQTIEEWTKRLPRLISIIQASPLLTELSLEIDHDVHLVFDPVIDALKNLQRPQGLKLTVMNARCEASVEIEAHTGRSLYVDLRVKKTKEADPFNHSLVRNLVIEEHCDLPSILIQVQKCIEHGAAVESIEIACDANNFVEWLESFRKLLTKNIDVK